MFFFTKSVLHARNYIMPTCTLKMPSSPSDRQIVKFVLYPEHSLFQQWKSMVVKYSKLTWMISLVIWLVLWPYIACIFQNNNYTYLSSRSLLKGRKCWVMLNVGIILGTSFSHSSSNFSVSLVASCCENRSFYSLPGCFDVGTHIWFYELILSQPDSA